MRRGLFAVGGALAVVGAFLFYLTSTVTTSERNPYNGKYEDVLMFDPLVSAIMLGVLIVGLLLVVYSLVAKQPEKALSPLWVIVPLGLFSALLVAAQGLVWRDEALQTALLLGSLPILGITFAIIVERRYRVLMGVLLMVASIIPMLYAPLLFQLVIGAIFGVIAGILTIIVYRSVPAEQEHVGEHA